LKKKRSFIVAKFVSPATAEHALRDRLAGIIRAHSNRNPRSAVAAIGPSEVGEACSRRLAYRMLGWDKTNDTSDPWPSISGTAIHAWLADAFVTDPDNWLVEHRVQVRTGLAGTVDLFDKINGIVIDHKCVGATSMKRATSSGPSEQQLVQINLYALGLEREGYTVNKVALAFYPLGGSLTGLHIWIGDYQPQIALDAINRLDLTTNLVLMLDPEKHPERMSAIPASPSSKCSWCPWYLPSSNDFAVGCPGE